MQTTLHSEKEMLSFSNGIATASAPLSAIPFKIQLGRYYFSQIWFIFWLKSLQFHVFPTWSPPGSRHPVPINNGPSSASKRQRNSRSPRNGPQLQNNTLNKQINILPSVLYPSEIQTPVEQWQVFLQKEKSLVFSNRVHYWLIRKCYATLLPTANPRYGSVTQIISTSSW